MKKTLLFFLVSFLWLLSSCSNRSDTIVISHHFLRQQSELLKNLILEFETLHPNIHIKAVYRDFQDLESDWNSRVYQSLKEFPQLMIIPHDRIGSLAEWKLIRPVDEILEPRISEFYPKAIQAVTYLDKKYAIPLSLEGLLLFYRKDLISQAPRSLKELLVQIKSLKTETRVAFPSHIPYFALPWIFAYGGSFYSPIGTLELDQKGNSAALIRYQHLIKLFGSDRIKEEKEAYRLFATGRSPFFITGQWSVESLMADHVPFGVTSLPSPLRSFIGVQCIALNAAVSQKEYQKIKLFLDFLIEKKFSNDLSVLSKYQSPLKQNVKSKNALRISDDPVLTVGRKLVKEGMLMNNHPDIVKLWKSLSPQVMEQLLSSKDPAFLLHTLQEQVLSE